MIHGTVARLALAAARSARSQDSNSAWYSGSLPGLTILVTVLAINLMGDGLRDALDPKLRSAA